jgi:uncharacterized protein YqkB
MTKAEVQAWAQRLEECAAQFVDAMVQFNASKNPELMAQAEKACDVGVQALRIVVAVEDIADEWPETT